MTMMIKKKDEVVPLLLIPGGGDNNNLHSVTMAGWRNVDGIELHIPTSYKEKRCCGSSQGWLIYAEEDLSLTLLNPFVHNMGGRRIIRLPPVKQRDDNQRRPHSSYEIQKVILSDDPDTASYEVLALHTLEGKLAYFKTGSSGTNNNWIYPDTEEGSRLRRFYGNKLCIQDIVHYRGKFYAVSPRGFIASLDLIINNAVTSVVLSEYLKVDDTSPIVDNHYNFKTYLVVSSSGSLLYVERLYYGVVGFYVMDGSVYDSDNRQFTQSFRVYEIKTDQHNNNIILEPWSSSSCINNQHEKEEAIFIGFNHAISAVGSSSSVSSLFIYYTDDFWWGNPLLDDDDDDADVDPSSNSYYQPYGPIDIGFFRINNGDDIDDDDEEQPKRMKNYLLEHSTSTKDPPPIWISFKLDYLSST